MVDADMNKQFLHACSQGFTLLEALIAMLVLSIGLLGLAGLQTSSARLGHEAHLRSVTTQAVSEIIEKIRMRTGKLSSIDRPAIIAQYASASEGACNPGDSSIANDFSCWRKNIAKELPEGTALIIDRLNSSFDIQISWFDRETQQNTTVTWTYVAGAL